MKNILKIIINSKFFYIVISFILFGCILFFSRNIFLNINDKKKIESIEESIDEIIEVEVVKKEDTTNVNPPENRDDLYWKFIEYNMIDVKIDELKTINSDVLGWIKLNNTNVNYPIVKTTDNDYYLNHQFDKKWNSAGWIFMDYRNNSDFISNKNTIIYGHGLQNDAMFGSLSETLKSNWYNNEKNLVIYTTSESQSFLWQIFSIYTIPTTNDYIKTDFANDEEFNIFLDLLKSRSIYNFNVSLNENDKILTLSTCYTNSKKLAIHAKLIKISSS